MCSYACGTYVIICIWLCICPMYICMCVHKYCKYAYMVTKIN